MTIMHTTPVSLGLPRVRSRDGALSRNKTAGRPATTNLIDPYGRVADDLRVSLTDRCNLRCTYCMPAEGFNWQKTANLLTAEEIVRLVSVATNKLGVKSVRFTGGEPLLRPELSDIIQACAQLPNRPELSLTTNAIGLANRAKSLREAGLDRLNISLDSLHPEIFAQLTRRPFLKQVLAGIDAAHETGFELIKINAVLISGINDTEAVPLLKWALKNGHQLRFIEQMPLDADRVWARTKLVTAEQIRTLLRTAFYLQPDQVPRRGAPAQLWNVQSLTSRLAGQVGIISSVTEPFCADCTRTRLTADGRIRNCLFSHQEANLMDILRGGGTDDELAQTWQAEMWEKGPGHQINTKNYRQPQRTMSNIGG